jgi:hypothetical protein
VAIMASYITVVVSHIGGLGCLGKTSQMHTTPCCHYRLQAVKNYEPRVAFDGVKKKKKGTICYESARGSRFMDPCFLDIDTSWRRMVSFTPLSLYPRRKSPWYYWIGNWVGLRIGLDDMEK